MKILNSWVYQLLERIADLFILNFLWIIMCLPIFTIFPSTVAMFGVTRKLITNKEHDGMLKTFFIMFKDNFKKSLLISLPWFGVAIFLYWDFQLLHPGHSIVQLVFFIPILLLMLVFISMTVYLFPILVHIDTSNKNTIRNALVVAVSHPLSTFLLVGLAVGMIYSLYKAPVLIFFTGSLCSYLMYSICHKTFSNIKIVGA